MSGSDSELISYYDSIFVENCCGFASIAFLVFDYAVTLDREVVFFWKGKHTGASILFFINRYLPILFNSVSFIGLAPLSDHGCSNIVHIAPILQILQYLPWAAFAALRVFALTDRRWLPALIVLILSLGPFAVNWYYYTTLISTYDPIFGCAATHMMPPGVSRRLTIASRTSLMAADAIVIAITWYVTYETTRLHGATRLSGTSFTSTLLRDGTIYFLVLLILNALHLAFSILPLTGKGSLPTTSYVTLFTEPISAVLVSRFLLNLQAVNQRLVNALLSSETHLATSRIFGDSVQFNRVVGSLGSDVSALHLDSYSEWVYDLGGSATEMGGLSTSHKDQQLIVSPGDGELV